MDAIAVYINSPLGIALAVVAALVLLGFVLFTASLFSPAPETGSPASLPNGMKIMQWTKTETDFLYKEIFGEDTEYGRQNLVKFKPGAVVVDAGANIGLFTLYAAQQCRGDATILSFEPIPTTHAVLAANAASAMKGEYDAQFKPTGSRSKLKIVTPQLGLSDRACSITFAHHPHLSIWSTADEQLAEDRLTRVEEDIARAVAASPNVVVRWLFPSWAARCCARAILRQKLGRTVQVKAQLQPLSDFIRQHKLPVIDVLKVDVEGAEMSVLRGIEASHWPLVQQVVAEVENFAERDEMCAFLQAKGFKTTARATERERTPGVESEVSMVYAVRPGYEGAEAAASVVKTPSSVRRRADSSATPAAAAKATPKSAVKSATTSAAMSTGKVPRELARLSVDGTPALGGANGQQAPTPRRR